MSADGKDILLQTVSFCVASIGRAAFTNALALCGHPEKLPMKAGLGRGRLCEVK
jgi:hypothetical protein